MGLSPLEVNSLSLWEFSAIISKFNEAHGGGKNKTDQGDLVEIANSLDSKPLIIRKK